MEVNKNIKYELRNELNYSELIVDTSTPYQENYQLQMIRENSISGFLKVSACRNDNCSRYIYDITGRTTMKRALENGVYGKQDIQEFMKQLLAMIAAGNNYMLDVNCVILDPQFIFMKENDYYFCYYPALDQTLPLSFHGLTEHWVKHIDYDDYASVAFVCGLHKESMKEQYNLIHLMESYTETTQPRVEMLEEDSTVDALDERMHLQGTESLWTQEEQLAEKEESKQKMKNMFRETTIAKYWKEKKKEKWGSWDDLLMEEESLIIDKKK